MNLTLVFRSKYRWPEYYFPVWSLGNSRKLLTTKQLLVSKYFSQLWIFLFSVCVLISIQLSPKKSIKSEAIWPVLYLVLLSCFAVHTLWAVAMLFNIFCELKEVRVLWPVFPDYSMLFLVTLMQWEISKQYFQKQPSDMFCKNRCS